MSKFEEALKAARAAGHDLTNDPPHSLSSVNRYTCTKCGKAVLGSDDNVYGSAVKEPCKPDGN